MRETAGQYRTHTDFWFPQCCDYLEKVLIDSSDCIMVRHECGEGESF